MSNPNLAPRPILECTACEGQLQVVARMPVRKDALTAQAFTLAQPGDQTPCVGVDVYRCHTCGKVEFYDHDFLLPAS